MTYEQAKNVLASHDQAHVLQFWGQLNDSQKEALLRQIEVLDFSSITRMQALLKNAQSKVSSSSPFEPAPVENPTGAELETCVAEGEKLLKEGKVAVLLVAGGQGSRLGYDGPKGAYPIGPITHNSLFWFHARKVLGLSQTYGVHIPFYVMTSESNDAATRAHFESNDYFGLPREDVFFFIQGMWPALTPAGKIILDTPGHIFMSPDGHGGTLMALNRSGAFDDMENRGIRHIFFFQVDNPMVEIADPAFIGLHEIRNADMSLKVCRKRDGHEGMGVVVTRNGHYEMVEYSELTDEQMERINPDGSLWLAYGSPAIHVFSYDFLKTEAARAMPIHLAHKKIAMISESGELIKPEAPNGYKFEKFIFDIIPNAKRLVTFEFERKNEFSPVKNATGNDSPATTQRDLQMKWRTWLEQLEIRVPDTLSIEIDPAYALNAKQLREHGLRIGC